MIICERILNRFMLLEREIKKEPPSAMSIDEDRLCGTIKNKLIELKDILKANTTDKIAYITRNYKDY